MDFQIELYLLRLFLEKPFFLKYSGSLNKVFIKDNNLVLSRLFEAIREWHTHAETPLSPSELELWYLSCYPASNEDEKALVAKLVQQIKVIDPKPELVEGYIKAHCERGKATELALLALQVSEGKKSYSELLSFSESLKLEEAEQKQDEFVTDNLDDLLTSQVSGGGLKWRLKSMNQMLGPLRQGDFGFIFKRPETGGTTFLASEVTHMAFQTDRPILWVNNEEQHKKVLIRCIQAHFGVTVGELFRNKDNFRKKFDGELAGRIKIPDIATPSKLEIEGLCARHNPALIIFDQIDKVRGFQNDRYDLEMKEIYQWARELAKNYGPVIGVCQASGSAEGKEWLTMDDVDSSKTAKQGEADWMLGIGKSHNPGLEAVRYFHLSKNKLMGDEETVPTLRHGRMPVLIKPDIARYEDLPEKHQ